MRLLSLLLQMWQKWFLLSDETVGARVMNAAVAAARDLAGPGDTVLLAPAGASFDQFSGYADRGDAFAAAVRAVCR